MATQPLELRTKITQIVHKAKRALVVAKRNYQEGDYDFAISRAYYATFYMITAALLTKQITPSKHSRAIGEFNRHFVHGGVFAKEFGRLISDLFRQRQMGDYSFDVTIDKVDAEEEIKKAERVIEAILIYLVDNGYLRSDE